VWFTWLSKELFRYSHYPIRFNRKNRKVYFFRLDGTVMCEDWEKLYFTLGVGEEHEEKEVRCHRLAEDGRTVLETYALPVPSQAHKPRSQWEFVRRYMEEGPEKVLPLIDHVLDVHIGKGRREGFIHGMKMMYTDVGWLIAYVGSPLFLFYAIGRWIAMRVAKYPEWPAEVEAECAVEPDDPYLVDADHLPKGVKP
ncbi:MAG: hypothetical protein LBF61_07870, partial [Azoarcus sp.]|nr:hypothetical protein [Azoarcus sp.]